MWIRRGACAFTAWSILRLYRIESMIPKDLLDVLVCPACRKPIVLKGNESLKCSACRRVYPIRDNIPILLIDQAVIDPA
jgi:LSD1 subclass zinc finger protein